MKAYVVGGAVRDRLLGAPVNDRDWVVVGATPDELLAAGYTPVGRDFPVFLHPVTHEQYALARTERKAARGYHGFVFHSAPDVTLEQDLARRDLTINAIAEDPDTGELIDPFGGRNDLANRVLRHVSDAFAEDPVRLLRLARFAARYPHFEVAAATMALLRRLVDGGEVNALVPERVWQEVSRGLGEVRPSRMFELLRVCGALARLAPMLEAVLARERQHVLTMHAVDHAAPAPPQRFACLCHALDAAALQALCGRWRVDADSRDTALLVAREWPAWHQDPLFTPASCLELLERCDAWRRPERLLVALSAFDALAQASGTALAARASTRSALVRQALSAAQAVGTASLPPAVRLQAGPALGDALRQARLQAIADTFARS